MSVKKATHSIARHATYGTMCLNSSPFTTRNGSLSSSVMPLITMKRGSRQVKTIQVIQN